MKQQNLFKSKVQITYNYQVIKYLKIKMDKNQLQVFQNTCFGHFLDIHPFVIQGQLLHVLLMQIKENRSKITSFFDINGQEICNPVNTL